MHSALCLLNIELLDIFVIALFHVPNSWSFVYIWLFIGEFHVFILIIRAKEVFVYEL